MFRTKDVDTLLDADDRPLPEKACVPGVSVLHEAVKEGLLAKLFPLDASSQILPHKVFPQD